MSSSFLLSLMGKREESMRPRLARHLAARSWPIVMFALLIAVPGMMVWAGRQQATTEGSVLDQVQAQIGRGLRVPDPTPRPEGRSPFGSFRPVWESGPEGRGRMLDTPLGLVDPGRVDDLRRQIPLLAGARGRALGRGRRGELSPGVNAVQVRGDALGSRDPDTLE